MHILKASPPSLCKAPKLRLGPRDRGTAKARENIQLKGNAKEKVGLEGKSEILWF